ncbi:MAG: efflux RND transporter periplasmic adaptor subunit [Burkholderiaceae bacterium]|nr:efflux RND transporter periplasmic adaptor subunit [Burkholderiaceae bacterium]
MSYRPNRRTLLRAAGACLVFSPALTWAGDEFAVSAAQIRAIGVTLKRLEADGAGPASAFPARVVLPPSQEFIVSAPLGGVVERLLVNENEAVRAGQPLLRLLSPELGEAQLRLAEAASKARLSRQLAERERRLFDEGVIAQRRVLEAEAAAAEDQARQRQAEAALRLLGLEPEVIRRVAEGGAPAEALVLRARQAGTVLRIDARIGQRANAADALLRLADTRRLWLEVQIPAAQREALSLGAGSLSGVGRTLSAKPLSLTPTVSDAQTLTLRAEVQRGGEGLRPGDVLQVNVPLSGSAGAAGAAASASFALPLAALTRQGEQAYVFVRSAKGFAATPVLVQDGPGGSVRVRSVPNAARTLQAGQEVATSAVIALKAAWLGKGGGE